MGFLCPNFINRLTEWLFLFWKQAVFHTQNTEGELKEIRISQEFQGRRSALAPGCGGCHSCRVGSILENAVKLGAKVLKWLTKFLAAFEHLVDDAADQVVDLSDTTDPCVGIG